LNWYSKIKFSVLLLFLFLTILLLPAEIINASFSVIVVILAVACGFLCYVLLIENDEAPTRLLRPTEFVITVSLILLLAIAAGYFSYWLVIFEPFEVVCKTRNCTIGPYGWSAALLSFILSVLMFTIIFTMFKRHFFSKDK
jgi:hypothetical protein